MSSTLPFCRRRRRVIGIAGFLAACRLRTLVGFLFFALAIALFSLGFGLLAFGTGLFGVAALALASG